MWNVLEVKNVKVYQFKKMYKQTVFHHYMSEVLSLLVLVSSELDMLM